MSAYKKIGIGILGLSLIALTFFTLSLRTDLKTLRNALIQEIPQLREQLSLGGVTNFDELGVDSGIRFDADSSNPILTKKEILVVDLDSGTSTANLLNNANGRLRIIRKLERIFHASGTLSSYIATSSIPQIPRDTSLSLSRILWNDTVATSWPKNTALPSASSTPQGHNASTTLFHLWEPAEYLTLNVFEFGGTFGSQYGGCSEEKGETGKSSSCEVATSSQIDKKTDENFKVIVTYDEYP